MSSPAHLTALVVGGEGEGVLADGEGEGELVVVRRHWRLVTRQCLAEGLHLHRQGSHRRSPGQLAALAHPGLSELEEFGSDRFTSDGLRPQLANDPWAMTPGR